jgi:hypothetical protein
MSHASVTDTGMVIEVELGGDITPAVWLTAEASELCIRWQRDDLGSFESRFHDFPQDSEKRPR